MVKAPVQTTNYLINSKRDHILTIESRYQIKIELHAEVNLISPHYLIENAFNEKRVKKKIDRNRPRSKKKDNENKKEIPKWHMIRRYLLMLQVKSKQGMLSHKKRGKRIGKESIKKI